MIERLFIPETPLIELVIRGTIMYIALLAALRFLVRRHVGSLSLMDLLLMVLIADAAQNAMGDNYRSITDGLVLCATLLGWNWLFDWMAFRFPAFKNILEPAPLLVVQRGKYQHKNMSKELLTEDELDSQLRQHGIQNVSSVVLAYVEPDGGISIVGNDSGQNPNDEKQTAGVA